MTEQIGFSPASELHADLTGQHKFELYLDLYRQYLDREIGWSEATSLLTPQYLHLHEEDIGSVGSYSMKAYLAGFVDSLGEECRSALEQIVFAYSYERESGLEPNNCLRQRFFAFELSNPSQHRQTLKEAIVGFGSQEVGRPVERSLEGPDGLVNVLRNCHLVQPYILELIKPFKVQCVHNIQDATVENIKHLIQTFKGTGCYQFSIYGYRFKPDSVNVWATSPVHRAFLEHAFVLHVLLWNYGLRSAHEKASVINRTMVELKKEWDHAKTATEQVFAKLNSFIPGSSSIIERDSTLPLPPAAFHVTEGLFRNTWGHAIGDFPKGSTDVESSSSFNEFYIAVRKYATAGYPAVCEFVNACGATEYLERAPSLTPDQRKSWERGIYAGTKLLTRRIQPDEEGNYGSELQGIGPDQVVLALLSGLPHSSKIGPKINVTYKGSIEGTTPEDRPQMFINSLKLTDPQKSAWPEFTSSWLDNGLGLSWYNHGNDLMNPYLSGFVRSGLIRSTEVLPNDILLHIPKASRSSQLDRIDRFLANLSRLVELCVKGDSNKGELHLEEINVVWSVSMSYNDMFVDYKSSKLIIELKCNGALESRENLHTGVFSRTLWGLNEFFSALLRGDKLEDSPGLSYVSESGASRLMVVLQSKKEMAV